MKKETSPPSLAPAEGPPLQRASLRDHPLGFWFFFWGEFAERCCYYGMRAVLLLYMIQILGFEDAKASRAISYFMAACYLLPLVGGYVADNFLGKYRTIVYFSIPYILGQAMLGIASLHNEVCLYLSLGLLAMGTGVIKPNISTLMGLTYDQQRPGRTKLRSDAFAMFYGAINIGSAISSFCVPAIRNHYGGDSRAYAIAFLFPAALMVMAFIVFAAGKPFYAAETIRRARPTPQERRQRWVVLRRVFGLFLVVTIFWSLYDQSVSTWTLFARDYLHLQFLGFKLSPDQLQAINPVLIVALLPPITMFWHWTARLGLDLKPTSKMLIGFLLTTLTMAITTWAGYRGAAVATAGAPAALAAAEQTCQAAAASISDPAANAAADMIVAAVAVTRAAAAARDDVEDAVAAAASAVEAAKKAVQEADPAATVAATAARAASASIGAARAAYALAAVEGDAAPPAVDQTREAAEDVQAAADATKEAIDLARETAQNSPAAKDRFAKVSAACAAAANRAAAAATAAGKAAAAVADDHDPPAAEVHAAVASLAAADAAAQVARAAADAQGVAAPASVDQTEQAAAAGRISLLWQIIPYLIITMAEICISVVGLELAFAAAPASMKSFVTACWLLTIFFGDILNAQITPFYDTAIPWCRSISLLPGNYFALSAAAMIPVTLAFMVMAQRFNRSAAQSQQDA